MPRIHFLNVKEGDCSIIQHYSGHVTVIDVCNAKSIDLIDEMVTKSLAAKESGILGNFNQKKYPVNPLSCLKDHDISSVFRFILTHPDMDHMDGIKLFFGEFAPTNFWDTDNEEDKEFEEGSPYDESDWLFYKNLRDRKSETNPKRLALFSGSIGRYYNRNEHGSAGGDGLHVLAPTPDFVKQANENADYNDCSYVILYKTNDHKIVFGGDSHDKTWEYILSTHYSDVKDIDLLIAPHHGRKSSRSYEFLDILKPRLTFFGNARSQDLAYTAWNYRNLPFITNNQAGSMVVLTDEKKLSLYVTHKPFAEKINPNTFYSEWLKGYFCIEF
jgi:competence protein ComEC